MLLGDRTRAQLGLALMAGLIGSSPVPAQMPERFRSVDGVLMRGDGPRADFYGGQQGYPSCRRLEYIDDPACRVGAFTAFEDLFPSRIVDRPELASPLARTVAEPEIRYRLEGRMRSIDDYLDRHPVTGLILAQGDRILVERYQYGRTDRHRFATFSMAKTVIGLLIGLAVADGAIRSIEDPAQAYAAELQGTEFGRTPIKALLTMTSGIAFEEDYADRASDIHTLARLALEQDPEGIVGAVRRFDRRIAEPGERFSYSSLDTVGLGLVLRGATGRSIADYVSERLWKPLGAEAAAAWTIDATGREIPYAYFHAVLRDWARLGLMLANKGEWAGRTVVPAAWIEAATRVETWPERTYGYHIWISPFDKSRFLLTGLRQQYLLIDPQLKLVLVQASLGGSPEADQEMYALWTAAREHLRQR